MAEWGAEPGWVGSDVPDRRGRHARRLRLAALAAVVTVGASVTVGVGGRGGSGDPASRSSARHTDPIPADAIGVRAATTTPDGLVPVGESLVQSAAMERALALPTCGDPGDLLAWGAPELAFDPTILPPPEIVPVSSLDTLLPLDQRIGDLADCVDGVVSGGLYGWLARDATGAVIARALAGPSDGTPAYFVGHPEGSKKLGSRLPTGQRFAGHLLDGTLWGVVDEFVLADPAGPAVPPTTQAPSGPPVAVAGTLRALHVVIDLADPEPEPADIGPVLRTTRFAPGASTAGALVGPTLLPDGYRPCSTDVSSTYEDADGEVLPAGAVYCGGDGELRLDAVTLEYEYAAGEGETVDVGGKPGVLRPNPEGGEGQTLEVAQLIPDPLFGRPVTWRWRLSGSASLPAEKMVATLASIPGWSPELAPNPAPAQQADPALVDRLELPPVQQVVEPISLNGAEVLAPLPAGTPTLVHPATAWSSAASGRSSAEFTAVRLGVVTTLTRFPVNYGGRPVYDFAHRYSGCVSSGPPAPPGSTLAPRGPLDCADHVLVDAVTGEPLGWMSTGLPPADG